MFVDSPEVVANLTRGVHYLESADQTAFNQLTALAQLTLGCALSFLDVGELVGSFPRAVFCFPHSISR